MPDGSRQLSVAVITVEPNEVLLRPFGNETMGVEAMPMGIKIPGNEQLELRPGLKARAGFSLQELCGLAPPAVLRGFSATVRFGGAGLRRWRSRRL